MAITSKRCAVCGLVNPLDAPACRRCHATQWATTAEAAAPSPPAPPPAARGVSARDVLVAVGLLLAFTGVAAALAFMSRPTGSTPTSAGSAPPASGARVRRDFANGVHNTLKQAGDDASVWTEGGESDVLVFRGSGVDTRLLTPATREQIRALGFRTVLLSNSSTGQRWEVDP